MQTIEPWIKLVPALIFMLTLIGAIIGMVKYDISLLQPLEKIANDQQEYRRKGEQEKFKKAITARHISLGNGLIEIGKFDEAKAEFAAALAVDPLNNEASIGLFKSQIINQSNNLEPNIEVMVKKVNMILQFTPNDAHAFYLLGMIYKDNDEKTAMRHFQKAIHLNSSLADAFFRIGMLYEIDNQLTTSEALEYYQIAYELSPLNETYLNNLAYQFLQAGEYQLAIEKYKELIKFNQNDLLPYITISHAFLRLNNFSESANYLNKLIQIVESKPFILESKLNKMQWFFEEFSENKVLLDTINKKLCYVYFQSFYKNVLIDQNFAAIADLKKGLQIYTKNELECAAVKRLIEFELFRYIPSTNVSQKLQERLTLEFAASFKSND